jgi:hypothetical protein
MLFFVACANFWTHRAGAGEQELQKRTLTNLYNQQPAWVELVQQRLAAAVLAAYGWAADLSDQEIVERLLALNLERAKALGLQPRATQRRSVNGPGLRGVPPAR